MTINSAYFGLIFLLALTFGATSANQGHMNEVVAWAISIAKTLIILMVFMKYRREPDDSRIYFIVGILTIILLLAGVLDDVLFRP
jgi:caa(3)-type oxidase subunit IV